MKVLKWARRYGALGAEEFDTLDEAVSSAFHASENGDEAFYCFEVWDDTGHRVIRGDEAVALLDAKDAEWNRAHPPLPKTVATVEVTSPTGEVAAWHGCASLEEADTVAARARSFLGDDRVSIRVW